MLEKTVESYLVDRVRAAGGDAYKFSSPARVSVPDRIVIFPPARVYFVELKRPGGKPTKGQVREHERLRALGCDVRVIDSREAVDAFVREATAHRYHAPTLLDEQIIQAGYMHCVDDDEPLFQFGRRELLLMVRELLAASPAEQHEAVPATDRESVIAEILRKLDGLITKGPLDEPAHSERNGLTLAFNAVARLSTEQPVADERAAYRDALALLGRGEGESSAELATIWSAAVAFARASSPNADDAARLDWLDTANAPLKMGWQVGVAPAGNVSIRAVIQLGDKLTSIRDAIDAARAGGTA
ncbi:hypothetical protein KPA96_19345 [Burkholderia cenocepacia]|uniref:hypothetical protein n=1 Tax=Burkholderia cenocepacia TaxID=95486 RepID=UPI00286568DD|nr:hypothetical protein [Burkholderia cenocepacia]MDR8077813.1 hypothetical protein [Burkholderia cenocepacia]